MSLNSNIPGGESKVISIPPDMLSSRDSLPAQDGSSLQCWKDTKSIFHRRGKAVVLGTSVALAGMIMCLVLSPESRIYDTNNVSMADVAEWATSSSSYAIDLASEACSTGGTAKALNYNQVSGQFELTCEEPRLSRRAFVTIGITIATLVAMVCDQPPDICMLGATLVLLLWPWADSSGPGIISEREAWQGFSNEGVLTVGALFVVAKAVDETGIVSLVMKTVLGEPKNLFVAQLRLLIPVAIASAFMNNTPIVAMLIPVVETWAPKIGHDPAKFMMPLSFASMLGGMCTMMGTSTNLVVQGLLKKEGMAPFGLFDIVPVGGPCCAVGILYMSILSRYLLGKSSNQQTPPPSDTLDGRPDDDTVPVHTYVVHFVCDSSHEQPHVSLEDLGLNDMTYRVDGAVVRELLRIESADGSVPGDYSRLRSVRDQWLPVHSGMSAPLRKGDIVVMQCQVQSIGALRRSLAKFGMHLVSELPTARRGQKLGRRRNLRFLAESVVGRHSPLLGMHRDIEDIGEITMSRYGASLISVRDTAALDANASVSSAADSVSGSGLDSSLLRGNDISAAASRNSSVQVGDVLLLEIFPRSMDLLQRDFTLVTAVPGSRPPRTGTFMDRLRMYISGTSLITMVALSATNTLSLLTAALLASAVLLMVKAVTLQEALSAIKGRTLLAIVTTFGLGTAMETTGAAHWIATGLISAFGSWGPLGVLLSVSLVTSVVGSAVSNNAVVILMYPICETLAAETPGVSLRQLLVVLLVGASSSFLTPMSYQTNLMVMVPGGYSFGDYFRFGLGLQLTMMACSIFMAIAMASYYE